MPTSYGNAVRQRWLVLAIGLGAWLITFNISSVNIALPTLTAAFGTTLTTIRWVALSYSLAIAGLVLGVARLGDFYSKKRLYLIGTSIFALGTILCGSAPNVHWLVGCRFLQGSGAVFMTTSGIAIVAETFRAKQRGRALGFVISFTSLGIAMGPPIGGSLIAFGSWRLIFWASVPISLITIRLVSYAAPPVEGRQVKGYFDGLGALIWIATLGGLILGTSQIQRWGLIDFRTLSWFAATAASFGLFLWVESRLARPMLDLTIFADLAIGLSLLGHALAFVVISGSALILPFFLELVKNYPPQQAGLLVAISPISAGLVSPLAGALSDRFSARPVTLIGFISLMLGCLAIGTFDSQVTVSSYLFGYIPFGLGIGLFQSPNSSAIVSRVSRLRLGTASGLLTLSRTLGQTIGIALIGLLFSTLISASGHDNSSGQLSTVPSDVVVSAFQTVFRVEATIVACAAIAISFAWSLEESP